MPHKEETELHIIIEGCLKNRREMQNQLYSRFYSFGMSVCMRYLSQKDDAVSVLNESFLKVFLNLKKYDVERPFEAWFGRILINTSLNHIKKRHAFRIEESAIHLENLHVSESALGNLQYEELIKVIQTLPDAYRTVFNLYVMDGFKHAEIAEALNINVGTSKSNLNRARARLREAIAKQEGGTNGK